jgi:hypothetical protein
MVAASIHIAKAPASNASKSGDHVLVVTESFISVAPTAIIVTHEISHAALAALASLAALAALAALASLKILASHAVHVAFAALAAFAAPSLFRTTRTSVLGLPIAEIHRRTPSTMRSSSTGIVSLQAAEWRSSSS